MSKKKEMWQNESVEWSGRDEMEGTQMHVTGEMANDANLGLDHAELGCSSQKLQLYSCRAWCNMEGFQNQGTRLELSDTFYFILFSHL